MHRSCVSHYQQARCCRLDGYDEGSVYDTVSLQGDDEGGARALCLISIVTGRDQYSREFTDLSA